jgi:hypothetical protein
MGYSEFDLTVDPKEMPRVQYMYLGKVAIYYPDIYIKLKNKIIEVKSDYTYYRYYDKNMAKRQRCIEMGMEFEFWVFDGSKNLMEI